MRALFIDCSFRERMAALSQNSDEYRLRSKMSRHSEIAVQVQRQYYTETAAQYEEMHASEAVDDAKNLATVCAFLRMTGANTLLDVGAGTGRAIRQLQAAMPEISMRGIEPVPALISRAVTQNGIGQGVITEGVGEALPFEDASFDAVCSFSILHHVAKPNAIVREMLRVARKAVIIIDGNRF